jgi:hypothetical protein
LTYFLYHYFDESTGPFRSLSDLRASEAEQVLHMIRDEGKGFASKRADDYLAIRKELETKARMMFEQKGGKPKREYPHSMTFDRCPWLLSWYPNAKELRMPLSDFAPDILSFTYGDLFPTMRYQDGKPYRKQVYTVHEIFKIINLYGLPQEWNVDGKLGPERYIEAQIWDDPVPLIS